VIGENKPSVCDVDVKASVSTGVVISGCSGDVFIVVSSLLHSTKDKKHKQNKTLKEVLFLCITKIGTPGKVSAKASSVHSLKNVNTFSLHSLHRLRLIVFALQIQVASSN
jgi:hypothetical protein